MKQFYHVEFLFKILWIPPIYWHYNLNIFNVTLILSIETSVIFQLRRNFMIYVKLHNLHTKFNIRHHLTRARSATDTKYRASYPKNVNYLSRKYNSITFLTHLTLFTWHQKLTYFKLSLVYTIIWNHLINKISTTEDDKR